MHEAAAPGVLAKLALRDQLLTARRRRDLLDHRNAADALAGHLLASPEVRRAATVAAYVSQPHEPGTGGVIDGLRSLGKRVIVPVLLPDNDLDWAVHADDLVPAMRGLLEPSGRRLGLDAVATADLVLVPALAVDGRGARLGRGGGSYDRALARVPVDTPVWALVYDDEFLDSVPVEAHDRPVTGVVTPRGVSRWTPPPGRRV